MAAIPGAARCRRGGVSVGGGQRLSTKSETKSEPPVSTPTPTKKGPAQSLAPARKGGRVKRWEGAQIWDRAASSATRVKSLWSWRMEAGTWGVTGPKKASFTMPALLSPETTITTRSACMMSQMPMV